MKLRLSESEAATYRRRRSEATTVGTATMRPTHIHVLEGSCEARDTLRTAQTESGKFDWLNKCVNFRIYMEACNL